MDRQLRRGELTVTAALIPGLWTPGAVVGRFHTVSAVVGHANVTTTAHYLNVKDDYLQELIERKPLILVNG